MCRRFAVERGDTFEHDDTSLGDQCGNDHHDIPSDGGAFGNEADE